MTINAEQPKRVQRQRKAGWKMPANTVYVGRPTTWGNPFIPGQARKRINAKSEIDAAGFRREEFVTAPMTAEECVAAFRKLVEFSLKHQPHFLEPLRGKNLACWCPLDQPCHADVLLELANIEPRK